MGESDGALPNAEEGDRGLKPSVDSLGKELLSRFVGRQFDLVHGGKEGKDGPGGGAELGGQFPGGKLFDALLADDVYGGSDDSFLGKFSFRWHDGPLLVGKSFEVQLVEVFLGEAKEGNICCVTSVTQHVLPIKGECVKREEKSAGRIESRLRSV